MSDQHMEPAVIAAMSAYFLVIFVIIMAVVIFSVWCYWRIAVKAGYSGPLSLLLLIPGANLVILILFAFTQWPIERELAALRAGAGGYYPPGGTGAPGGYQPPPPPPPGPPMTTG